MKEPMRDDRDEVGYAQLVFVISQTKEGNCCLRNNTRLSCQLVWTATLNIPRCGMVSQGTGCFFQRSCMQCCSRSRAAGSSGTCYRTSDSQVNMRKIGLGHEFPHLCVTPLQRPRGIKPMGHHSDIDATRQTI